MSQFCKAKSIFLAILILISGEATSQTKATDATLLDPADLSEEELLRELSIAERKQILSSESGAIYLERLNHARMDLMGELARTPEGQKKLLAIPGLGHSTLLWSAGGRKLLKTTPEGRASIEQHNREIKSKIDAMRKREETPEGRAVNEQMKREWAERGKAKHEARLKRKEHDRFRDVIKKTRNIGMEVCKYGVLKSSLTSPAGDRIQDVQGALVATLEEVSSDAYSAKFRSIGWGKTKQTVIPEGYKMVGYPVFGEIKSDPGFVFWDETLGWSNCGLLQ